VLQAPTREWQRLQTVRPITRARSPQLEQSNVDVAATRSAADVAPLRVGVRNSLEGFRK
jgi:hypothetical protein